MDEMFHTHRQVTGLRAYLPTGRFLYLQVMAFQLTPLDGRAEEIGIADTYEQEGPLTTFFSTSGREYVDSWAVRLASFRTADIASIRRVIDSAEQFEQLPRFVDDFHRAGVA